MPVYVGIDVHRKCSHVALIDQSGEVLASRNVPNGAEPILGVIGGLPPGTPTAFEIRSPGVVFGESGKPMGLSWPAAVSEHAGRDVSETLGEVQQRHTTIVAGPAFVSYRRAHRGSGAGLAAGYSGFEFWLGLTGCWRAEQRGHPGVA